MNLEYLDEFSGYGGFHLGLEESGFKFKKVYFSEINKYAIANYLYNFITPIYVGGIQFVCQLTNIKPDIFTFGWPCQDNSIAGKRAGQKDGTRSGLLFEAIKIISKYKPRHFIAENVLGIASVNKGIDYVEAIRILAYLNENVPQYDVEMQLCNSRWILPQNRERLFFVGHLRGQGGRQIFPITEADYCDETNIENKQREGTGIWSDNNRIVSPTLTKHYARDLAQIVIKNKDVFRRFTPIECERMQGLPDDWTKYGIFNGKTQEIKNTNRYELCGNGVSVGIIKVISSKLLKLNY